ncbi:YagK/YfjJ domain-containing protein [Shewanella scandinavica]
MLSFYSRVLVCRIDLHPGQCSADNQLINQYLKKLTHLLTKHYDCKVLYHCAREQNTSEVEHYHVELMLSGHKINHSEKLLSQAKSMWEQHSKGTVSFVDCSGQVKLATVLESFQYKRSDSFGVNPPLY